MTSSETGQASGDTRDRTIEVDGEAQTMACFSSCALLVGSRRMFVKALVAVALAQLATGPTHAAVPAKVIKAWQDNAPEMLEVTVLSISKTSETSPSDIMGSGGSVTTGDISLTAKIDQVHRTASNLKPGDEIIIKYKFRRYTPIPPPDGNYGVILNSGEKATAYLKQVGGTAYELACDTGCLISR
jgi:hypothetical protein